MNIYKYLILIKGQDKTENIIKYTNDKYYININYTNT